MDLANKDDAYRMFDRISGRYDLLNRLLSFGQDILWRRRLSKLPGFRQDQVFLDLATGTGDILFTFLKRRSDISHGIGLDMSSQMMQHAKRKATKKREEKRCAFIRGDANRIPGKSDRFDFTTMAFGIRNISDPQVTIDEIYRVLKPGGMVLILEFSIPPNPLFRPLFLFYLRRILPLVGMIVSGDSMAYRYLNESIEDFPYGRAFADLLDKAGFGDIALFPLTFGIATIYRGIK